MEIIIESDKKKKNYTIFNLIKQKKIPYRKKHDFKNDKFIVNIHFARISHTGSKQSQGDAM